MAANNPLIFVFLTLVLIAVACAIQTIQVNLDPKKTGAPISKYIYGQFIEHLGRCIYGGIWAEMLEDRKFYHPITSEYHPYTDLLDTPYPVVGRSPWQIVGGKVGMTTDHPFVGQHSVTMEAGSTIRQNDLGVVAGKKYEGYLWARPGSDADLTLTLDWGAGSESHRIKIADQIFTKVSFQFTAEASTDRASFAIASDRDVVIGAVSLMLADNVHGMRRDTLALLKELGGTIYRWPGGNFVSGYDWRDGIGDRDRRPPKTNSAWTGLESNDFGTDEFIAFCHEIGAEPLITVNTGFGDAYSAAQWVEYCNAGPNTVGGKWRVDNGHPKPHGVRYWCVGNEMWGPWQLGFMQLNQYVIKHNWIAEAMHRVDPSLELVASGDLNTINKDHDPDQVRRNIGWSQGMLEGCSQNMDLISEHFYCGRLPWNHQAQPDVLTRVAEIRNAIKEKADGHRKIQPKVKPLNGRIVPIAMDEWNYWHREYTYGELGCSYDLIDGLGIAAGLHEFFRQSELITMATYAQTVNVIGCLKSSRTAAELESTGLVLGMYRRHFGTRPVLISGDAGHCDVAAALTEDCKSLTVGIVNPTLGAVKVTLNFDAAVKLGAMRRYCLTGNDASAHNSPGSPRQVDIVETAGLAPANGLELPSLACGVFVIPLRARPEK